MLDLKDREWSEFRIGDLFSLKAGKGKGLNHLKIVPNGISYLGATNRNNAVLCQVVQNNDLIQPGNCIAFIRNGEGSMGYSVYKAEPFIASSDLTLGYSDNLNKYVGLFITTVADTIRGKYNFNYKRSDSRLAKEILRLPASDSDNPDWGFMEDFVRERERGLVAEYAAYAEQILYECEDVGDTVPLKEKKWAEFILPDIFSIQSTSSSIDKIKLNHGSGAYPYITRTERNNGIDSFVREQKKYQIDVGNCITIGLDTQTAFYQPAAFYTGQNIQILRNENLNPHTAKFLLPLLKNLLTIFDWGSSGATLTRLRRSKILLPLDDSGKPDWVYMEQYAKRETARQLKAYLEYAATGN